MAAGSEPQLLTVTHQKGTARPPVRLDWNCRWRVSIHVRPSKGQASKNGPSLQSDLLVAGVINTSAKSEPAVIAGKTELDRDSVNEVMQPGAFMGKSCRCFLRARASEDHSPKGIHAHYSRGCQDPSE